MLTALLALALSPHGHQIVASVTGNEVVVRAVRAGENLHLEFLAIGRDGKPAVAAVSSGHPDARPIQENLASLGGLLFTHATTQGNILTLSGDRFVCTIDAPSEGRAVSISVDSRVPGTSLDDALFAIVLAPNDSPRRATKSFFPFTATAGLAPMERLATPVALVEGGGFGLSLLPDVQGLEANRPMPPVLLLDNEGKMSPGAMLAYGFAPYDRDSAWRPQLIRRKLGCPSRFSWNFDLVVSKEGETVSDTLDYLWKRDGELRAEKPFPQTVPFQFYTKPTLDLAPTSDERERGESIWWTAQRNGDAVRAPKGADRQAKLTNDGNIARFAWGQRWWGVTLDQYNWRDFADETMNLVLTAQLQQGTVPVAFDTDGETWRYESSSTEALAQTGRWMVEYAASFSDYPRRDKLIERARQFAEHLMLEPVTGQSALFLAMASPELGRNDSDLQTRLNQFTKAAEPRVRALAELYTRQSARPSAETVAAALFLARSAEDESRRAAHELLRSIFLHQALWQPTTIAGTEIFGGFVGEHYLEESQSVYTADLFEACMLLGDRVLAQRALAAVRAPLALFYNQTLSISGIRLPDDIAAFRSSPWFGNNGMSEFGAWRGAAEGIGQTLAALAQVTREYGSHYTHKDGWSIGIDGIRLDSAGKPYNGFSSNPYAYLGPYPYVHIDGGTGSRTKLDRFDTYPAMRAITLVTDPQGIAVVALPGFTTSDATQSLSGSFTFGDGTRVPAEFLSKGFGARVTPDVLASGPVSFQGKYKEWPLVLGKTYLLAAPPALDQPWPLGWRRMKGLSDVVRATATDSTVAKTLSTADNGRAARLPSLMGIIESQAFLLTSSQLVVNCSIGGGEGVRIEIVDAEYGVPVTVVTTEGESVCDLTTSRGRLMKIRLVDESVSGWIELTSVRT